MQKAGLAFIAFAMVILAFFGLDVWLAGASRHDARTEADSIEGVEGQEFDDTEEPEPTIIEEMEVLLAPRMVLNAEERRYLYAGSDYEYVVVEGDVIDDLARKYLGDHQLKSEIYDRNPDLVRGERLPAGKKIVIPFSARR